MHHALNLDAYVRVSRSSDARGRASSPLRSSGSGSRHGRNCTTQALRGTSRSLTSAAAECADPSSTQWARLSCESCSCSLSLSATGSAKPGARGRSRQRTLRGGDRRGGRKPGVQFGVQCERNSRALRRIHGGLGLDPATAAAMVGHDDGGYLIATVYTKLAQRRALARAQRAMDAVSERRRVASLGGAYIGLRSERSPGRAWDLLPCPVRAPLVCSTG